MNSDDEYLIEWHAPKGYDAAGVLRSLPSPISRNMQEIYNYCVKPNGFWVVDRHVDETIVRKVLGIFVAEALSYTDVVAVKKTVSSGKNQK